MAKTNKLTLTEFMSQTRAFLAAAGIFLVGVTIWQIAAGFYALLFPEKIVRMPPTPDYKFKALPRINFPYQEPSLKPTSYTLMADGVSVDQPNSWPAFGDMDVITLYKLKPMSFSLMGDQKARDIAKRLNFPGQPNIIDDRKFLYTYLGNPLEESLTIDTKTMFLTLDTNYLSTTNVYGTTTLTGEKQVPDRVEGIKAVRHYLNEAGILPPDLSDQAAVVEYQKGVGNRLEPVQNVIEADYIAVSLPRVPLPGFKNDQPSQYKFYGPDNISSVYGVVGKTREGENFVVHLRSYYYSLDMIDTATYPLRGSLSAWQSLQAGEGYVVNPRRLRNVTIRNIELGFYESNQEQEFLLPIYVFHGDNGFMAYVQALHPNVLRNE